MAITHKLRRLASVALIGGGIAFAAISTPIVLGALTPAAAQISEDAQVALEQYGSWRPHPRFGNVWVPTGVPPDWRPYAYGHWVYTDEWGWYWVSDDVEADWGWVVYHYGRWAFERGFGWYWVSGDEWAPAWVDWRYGDDYSGWAPLPPDELIGTYEVEPTYWVFVPTRYIAAPRLRTYYVPVQRRSVILRSTHIVNRTFAVRGSRLAVNPGISPAFVARVSGAPVSTFRVRPRVFASTQGVAGAVQIRREDLGGARGGRPGGPGGPAGPGARTRLGTVSVERTTAVIQPSAAGTAPQPLGKNEPGRLGTHPPRAAQGAAPTPSIAPVQGQPPSPPPPSRLHRHRLHRRRQMLAGQRRHRAQVCARGRRRPRRRRRLPRRRLHPRQLHPRRRQERMCRLSGWSGAKNVVICVHQLVRAAERRRLDSRLRRHSRILCGRFRHRHRRLRRHLRRKSGGCSRRHHLHLHLRRSNGRCSRHRRPRCVRRRLRRPLCVRRRRHHRRPPVHLRRHHHHRLRARPRRRRKHRRRRSHHRSRVRSRLSRRSSVRH